MDENLNTVDAVQENVVDSQTNEQVETVETVNAGNEDVATSQQEKPIQTQEENHKWSELRKEKEAAEKRANQIQRDYEIAKKYGAEWGIFSEQDIINNYSAQGIKSLEDFVTAVEKQEYEQQKQQDIQSKADKYEVNPDFVAYVKSLEEKNNQLEQKVTSIETQTKAEKEAAETAKFEASLKNEMSEVIKKAKEEGFEITEDQLLNAAVENNLADMKKVYKLIKPDVDMETVKQNAIKEYIDNIRAGKVPVEGSGSSAAIVTETPKTFEDARKGAQAMLRAANLFK